MKFNSSYTIDDEYWQSDDHYVLLDEVKRTIQFQLFRVRYGPGDDYQTLIDEEYSLSEFAARKDLQTRVKDWFGETALTTILEKAAELS